MYPLDVPQNVGNRVSEGQKLKIFWGRMPPYPPKKFAFLSCKPPNLKHTCAVPDGLYASRTHLQGRDVEYR